MNSRSKFPNLTKLSKPFSFEQDISVASLHHKGAARIKIDNWKLELGEALISPHSSINLISAGRAFRLASVTTSKFCNYVIVETINFHQTVIYFYIYLDLKSR